MTKTSVNEQISSSMGSTQTGLRSSDSSVMSRLDAGKDPAQTAMTTQTQPKPKAEKEKKPMISAKQIKKQYGRQYGRLQHIIATLRRRATVFHASLDAEDKAHAPSRARKHWVWDYVLLYLVLVSLAQVLCSTRVNGPDKLSDPIGGPDKLSDPIGGADKLSDPIGGPDKLSDPIGGPDKLSDPIGGADKLSDPIGAAVDKPTIPMADAAGPKPLWNDKTKDSNEETSELVAESRDKRALLSSPCSGTKMQCIHSRECIPAHRWCDGHPDCDDKKSDEDNCESYECDGDRVKCGGNSHLCIDNKDRCDGNAETGHCGHIPGESELGCDEYKCRGEMVKCGNGSNLCVLSNYKCDGVANNIDLDGFQVCGGLTGDEQDCENYTCRGDMVPCGGDSNLCVASIHRCSGVGEKEFAENQTCGKTNKDEEDCESDKDVCQNDMIQCPKKDLCMYYGDRCNNIATAQYNSTGMANPCDSDGTDDVMCGKTDNCTGDWMKCTDGQRCYHKEWKCDGVKSCDDGSDEANCTAINGTPGDWSDWECGIKCGNGTGRRIKRRNCDSKKPKFGGNCTGPLIQRQDCVGLKACPGVGNWTDWDKCSPNITLGCGTNATRTRKCNNPAPVVGGLNCSLPLFEYKVCLCPVHGNVSKWGTWKCGVTCGSGTAKRIRQCNNPRPSNGGADCTDELIERKECGLEPCPTGGSSSPNTGVEFAKACNETGHWRCTDGKTCIPESQKCDGNNDCEDKSDELNCSSAASLLYVPASLLLMSFLAVMASLLM